MNEEPENSHLYFTGSLAVEKCFASNQDFGVVKNRERVFLKQSSRSEGYNQFHLELRSYQTWKI